MTGPYRKGSLAEYEACHLLKQQGWIVSRWYGNPSPPDLFAARKAEILLVMVRHARRPVPNAHAVSLAYGEELDRLRMIGNPDTVKKECWVLAPPDGWKQYEVLPGGIRRIWHEPADFVKADTLLENDQAYFGTPVKNVASFSRHSPPPESQAAGNPSVAEVGAEVGRCIIAEPRVGERA
jgi:hypothetical protein